MNLQCNVVTKFTQTEAWALENYQNDKKEKHAIFKNLKNA